MEMKGSNIGFVVTMFVMAGVVIGQYVDPDFVDDSLTDADFTTFENFRNPSPAVPPQHQNPIPVIPPRLRNPLPVTSPPSQDILPVFPKSSPPPPFHHAPRKEHSCLRRCRKNCTNDKVILRRACFEACPSNCRIFHEGSKSLKKCLLSCIEAIPTYPAAAFVAEKNHILKNMKGQLDTCYNICISRIRIDN
ncbi:hypothetical protein ACFX11_046605 [Malus domestica]